MRNLFLKVEALAGSEIRRTCDEAIQLADKLGITVEFNFNEVIVLARPGDDYEELAEAWNKALHSKYQIKMASTSRYQNE